MVLLSPYDLVLEKVHRCEVDPEEVDLERLIEEFRECFERLENSDYLRTAGKFLSAVASLLKLKILKFFPEESKEKERKPRVKLSEVLEVLKEEDDLEWLYRYEVKVGRPQGKRDTRDRQRVEPESLPLHREFKVEDYRKVLEDIGIEDFERLKAFLCKVNDRVERIRFFMAWLM